VVLRPATRVVHRLPALSQQGSATEFHVFKAPYISLTVFHCQPDYLRICGNPCSSVLAGSTASSKFSSKTTALRQGSMALSARAVTMVMAARSDVLYPLSRRHFQVVVVFVCIPDSDIGILICNFELFRMGKVRTPSTPRGALILQRPQPKSIDSITMPPGKTLLSRHRHGTKTRNHHNVAELIFPHCVRVQARGCSLRGIKQCILPLYLVSPFNARLSGPR
jgi:hypothetical protein